MSYRKGILQGEQTMKAGNKIPDGILDSQQKNIETINNIVKDHAQPHDFSGVAKELAGEQIVGPKGIPYDHVGEMRDSLKGLNKSIKRLESSLKDPSHSKAVRDYINSEIAKARRISEMMKKSLSGGK